MRDIARAAGVSAQTVYDSVGTKQALVSRLTYPGISPDGNFVAFDTFDFDNDFADAAFELALAWDEHRERT